MRSALLGVQAYLPNYPLALTTAGKTRASPEAGPARTQVLQVVRQSSTSRLPPSVSGGQKWLPADMRRLIVEPISRRVKWGFLPGRRRSLGHEPSC